MNAKELRQNDNDPSPTLFAAQTWQDSQALASSRLDILWHRRSSFRPKLKPPLRCTDTLLKTLASTRRSSFARVGKVGDGGAMEIADWMWNGVSVRTGQRFVGCVLCVFQAIAQAAIWQ